MRSICIASAAAMFVGSVATASAGGFSRGTADTDILYEDGNFNMRAGAIIVVPTQKFKTAPNVQFAPGLTGTNYLGNYVIPSGAVKLKISDALSCAGTYTDAYGANSVYAVPYGATALLNEKFTVTEFGATCAAFFDMGRGRLSVLGGAFIEQFNYDATAQGGALDLGLNSTAYGWRAGLGYEIPEIAFRAQLLYRSGTSHSATGTANGLPIAAGSGELPQTVELKVQSGIAPGWLAFGSVKWMDWSVNETLQVTINGAPLPPNQYYWRDGWTITGGIGHAFTENVSGSLSVQWDRGVANGYDFRTDKWLVAAGLGMKDAMGGELRLGAAVSYLNSAEVTALDAVHRGASVESGWAALFSANYKVKW